MKMRIFITGITLLLTLCSLSPAQTIFNNSLGDNDFNQADNWSLGLPGVNGGGDATVTGLAILSTDYNRPLGAFMLMVGNENSGELVIPANMQLNTGDDVIVGRYPGVKATVDIYGTLQVSGTGIDTFIGDGGTGEVVVYNGGFLDGRKAIEILDGRVYYYPQAVPSAVQDEFVVDNSGTLAFETDGPTVATVAGSSLILELGANSTLEMILTGEYSIGDSWTLFTGISNFRGVNNGDGDGTFANVISPQGFGIDMAYDATGGTVTATLASAAVLPVQPAYTRNVSVNTILEWKSGSIETINGYDVYLTSDPNLLMTSKIVSKKMDTSYTPALALDYGKTYYWRIDVYEPNTVGPEILHEGALWSFTTEPPDPLVLSDPEPFVVVQAGEVAQFSISAQNAETYRWYKEGSPSPLIDGENVSGATTAVITLSNISQGDEGLYYCEVSNSLSSVVNVSKSGRLMTRRLLGHWDFEDTLVDTVDGWTGRFVDATTETEETPVILDGGISGKAIQFDNNSKVVRIDQEGAAEYFNFYPEGLTICAWVKADEVNAYATAVTKQDNGGSIGWMLRCPDVGQFNLKQATDATVASLDTLTDGAWHLLAGQYDGQFLKLYVDGILIDTSSENMNAIDVHTDPLTFGAARPNGTGGFKGLVDEIMIWNYAIDPYEIAQLYADLTGESVCVEISPYDLNGDCIVDVEDLDIFIDQWLLNNMIYPNP